MRYLLSRSSLHPLYNSTKRHFYSARSLLNVKPFLLADIGEGITECEVVQWFVKPGDTVEEFDKICEVQSDKASVEISSRYAGSILKLHYNPNDVAKVGYPLVDIETSSMEEDGPSKIIEQIAEKVPAQQTNTQGYQALWQSPSVHRLLQEYQLEIGQINGSGKNSRVLKGDVLDFIKTKSLKKVPKTANQPKVKKVEEEVVHAVETDRTVPLTSIQRAMFKAMTKSLDIPQLGFKDDINLNETQKYRESLNRYIAQKPDEYPFKKISYLPIFIKCMSIALTQYPILNAQVAKEGGILYRSNHNIGIAMDTPNGLLVPNIKHVQDKSIFQIASDIHRLLELGKQGKLGPDDLKDGTITISNIGSIGGTYANPVIVSSEISIVALGSIRKLPSYDGEKTVPKHILPVSWSADHRVIDGATIARFSNLWKSLIENPALLASMLH
ncbi:hypothetical protein K501DRAFT_222767 [Backusella circina FSU 941]|nr:hypothetical protein K501DRAFT_222767 [Backusella circina FSU 941]